MARGNGRQDIVQDDADRGRLVACLERGEGGRDGRCMPLSSQTNHLHLVLGGWRPNLAKGVQLFLYIVRQWVGWWSPPVPGTSSRAATGRGWSRTRGVCRY